MLHTRMSFDSGAVAAAATLPLAGDVGRLAREEVPSSRQQFVSKIDNDGRRDAGAGIITVPRPAGELTFLQTLVSLAGASAISLTIPFVVLLIGLPVALAIRGLLELITWVLRIALT